MGNIDEKINTLTMMEQSISEMTEQKKKFQTQLIEIESAINELEQEKETYKIIGNFMFKKEPKKLKEELTEKKDLLKIRIKSFEKQEKEAEKQFKELQQEIMEKLKK